MAQAFFEVFITTVKKEHGLVKMYGQPDPQTGEVVRKYLAAVVPQLEGGSPPTADKVNIKQSVIARYDGGWYRAQVLAISGQKYTMYFVDYGNVNDVTLADIRIGLHSQLNQISPQVYPFYLADVVPPARDWSKPSMEFIEDALVNVLCRCIVVRRVKGYCFIRIFKPDSSDPFINDLVHCGMAVLGNPNMDLVPSLEQRQLAPMTSRPPLGYPPMLPPGSMGPPSPNFPTSLSPQPPMFPTQRVSPQPHHSFPPPGPPPIQPVLPTHHASHPRLQSLNPSLPRGLMHGQHPNDLSGIRMNRDSHTRQQHSHINHLPVQPLGRGSLVGNRVPGPHLDRSVRFRPMQLEEDSEAVNYNAVSSIPDRLVSQLPAQAVRCKLVGPCEERDNVSRAVLEAFENLLNPDSPFSVIVEKKIQNVHYLQMDVPSINDWPEELKEKLFSKFHPSDLGAALLVCRTWKRLGEQPKLWEWINLKVTQRNVAAMPQILAMERLKTQKEIHIFAVSEELLKAIGSHLALKTLHVKCCISSVDPALLARVIHKMGEADLDEAELTPQQGQAIYNFFGYESKLRKLCMSFTDLSAVDPQVLARAVTMLEEVDIERSHLNDEQCQTIFQFLNGESKLKVLNIGLNVLHSVQPEVLARAIVKLEVIGLKCAYLTAQQCQQVFQLIGRESQLKKLDIGYNDLSSVRPELLAEAIVKLDEVVLDITQLTPEQCQSIFKVASYGSKMKKLSIGWNDLTSVNPDVLARVAVKLEEVSLKEATLTADQYQTIFKLASSNSSKLKSVAMWRNDLSPVDPEELAKAVSKLEEVEFTHQVKLTAVQCQAIFEFASCESSKLNRVCIASTDLSSAAPEALAKAVSKLEEVRFALTKLTPQQSQAMFKIASGESKLKILDMEGNDLSSVEPKTLDKVIHKMEDVNLRGTKLTNEQCQAIFEVASCESKLKKIKMCENNLSFIDPELLGKVLNKVEVAWLSSTQLTTLQCETIFKFVLGDTKLINLKMPGNDFSKVNPETLDKVEAKFNSFKR